jgi:hypothetical protein
MQSIGSTMEGNFKRREPSFSNKKYYYSNYLSRSFSMSFPRRRKSSEFNKAKVLPMSLYESVTYVYRLYPLYISCPFFARPMTIRQDSRIGRTHVRPKGELHGWSESKDERKGAPVNPPFGFVLSLEKSGPRLNFFRIEEIDALHVCPQGEVQGCTESNSLRSNKSRFPLNFPALAHRVQRGINWRNTLRVVDQVGLVASSTIAISLSVRP